MASQPTNPSDPSDSTARSGKHQLVLPFCTLNMKIQDHLLIIQSKDYMAEQTFQQVHRNELPHARSKMSLA